MTTSTAPTTTEQPHRYQVVKKHSKRAQSTFGRPKFGHRTVADHGEAQLIAELWWEDPCVSALWLYRDGEQIVHRDRQPAPPGQVNA